MPGINLAIDALSRDMEKTSEDLNLLLFDLGQKAVPWHNAIAFAPSNELYETICEVLKEREKVLSEIEAVKKALSELSTSDNEINKAMMSLSDIDDSLQLVMSSIGAVAAEAEKANKLDSQVLPCMQAFHDYQNQERELAVKMASSKGLSKTLAEFQYKNLSKSLKQVFTKVGQSIIDTDSDIYLTSEKAKALAEQAHKLINQKEEFSETINSHKNMKQEAHSSLEQMGALGTENRKLKSLEAQDKQIAENLNLLYIDYAQILSKGMDDWLDDQAPEDLKNSCALIKDQKRRIREQKLNMQLLNSEKELEVHQGQTELLAGQLSHLNSQLALIERQKTDIQIKLEEEKKAIEDLKKKQEEINSLF